MWTFSNAQMSDFKDWGNLWLPHMYLLTGVARRFGEQLGWSLSSLVLLKKSAFWYAFYFRSLKTTFMPDMMKQRLTWSRGELKNGRHAQRPLTHFLWPEDSNPLPQALFYLEFKVYRGFSFQELGNPIGKIGYTILLRLLDCFRLTLSISRGRSPSEISVFSWAARISWAAWYA